MNRRVAPCLVLGAIVSFVNVASPIDWTKKRQENFWGLFIVPDLEIATGKKKKHAGNLFLLERSLCEDKTFDLGNGLGGAWRCEKKHSQAWSRSVRGDKTQ